MFDWRRLDRTFAMLGTAAASGVVLLVAMKVSLKLAIGLLVVGGAFLAGYLIGRMLL